MHDAALSADLIPHRLSFVKGLRAARRTARTQPGLSPQTIKTAHQQAIAEILAQPLPQRRTRRTALSHNARSQGLIQRVQVVPLLAILAVVAYG